MTTTEQSMAKKACTVQEQVRAYGSPGEIHMRMGIAETLVRQAIKNGDLPATQFVKNGRILVRFEDADQWAERNRIVPADATEVWTVRHSLDPLVTSGSSPTTTAPTVRASDDEVL